MSKNHLTIKYAEQELQKLNDGNYDNANKFIIEFLEMMDINKISKVNCQLIANIYKETILNLKSKTFFKLIALMNIFLELMKPEPNSSRVSDMNLR